MSAVKLCRLFCQLADWKEEMQYFLFLRQKTLPIKFRIPNSLKIPACFSRASANLWPGRGFARIGCSPDETCGAYPAPEGAMKCPRTYSYAYDFNIEVGLVNFIKAERNKIH